MGGMSVIPLPITRREIWDYVKLEAEYAGADPSTIDIRTLFELVASADNTFLDRQNTIRERESKKTKGKNNG